MSPHPRHPATPHDAAIVPALVQPLRTPRLGVLLLAAALAVVFVLGVLPGLAQAAVGYDAEELAFLRQLNEYRADNGRQPLLLSDQLSATAERHASDMGTYKYFSHVTERSQRYPVGSEPWDRLEYDGYDGGASGENLAAGAGTAAAVFALWRESAGHRANMLDPTSGGQRVVFREIGIARVFVPGSPYGWYWATEFGGSLDPTAHDPFAVAAPPGPFPDVPGNHAYARAIEALTETGVISGYGDGTFRPQETVWRQHFAKMIVECLDLPVDETCVAPFSDVGVGGPDTLYPDNYIACAAENGITSGVKPGRFAPTAAISRAQVVTMVVRAAEGLHPGTLVEPPAGYASPWCDRLRDSVHADSARLAAYNGLLAGLPVAALDPWGGMPRGEVAQVLYNMQGLIGY